MIINCIFKRASGHISFYTILIAILVLKYEMPQTARDIIPWRSFLSGSDLGIKQDNWKMKEVGFFTGSATLFLLIYIVTPVLFFTLVNLSLKLIVKKPENDQENLSNLTRKEKLKLFASKYFAYITTKFFLDLFL